MMSFYREVNMEEYYPVIRGLVYSSWKVACRVICLCLFFGIIFMPTIVHADFVNKLERVCSWDTGHYQCLLTEASRDKMNISVRWAAAILSILTLISSVRLPWDCRYNGWECRFGDENFKFWCRNPVEWNALFSTVHLLYSIGLWGATILFIVIFNKTDPITMAISFIPLYVYIIGSLSWRVRCEYEKYMTNNPIVGQNAVIDPSTRSEIIVELESTESTDI